MSSTQDNKPAREKRSDNRKRTFLPARISFREGSLSVECTVTQLSPAGARLIIPESVALPDRFDFSIPQRSLNCRARLIWRKDEEAGVEFELADDVPVTIETCLERIRELEETNAKLRAQVSELLIQVQRLTDL
ncbi:MAG TPA: PilZ domain-containing protein [Roseiarcus sp.]|nr:PilZ domain-containing protein [Roseiarcus sp.]